MSETPYKALLAWAEENGHVVKVSKAGLEGLEPSWTVSVTVDDPVKFTAVGSAGTIDQAAQKAMADLRTVGVPLKE